MPGDADDRTRCARPSSAVAWNRSLTRRSSRSRPANGASSAAARPSPPRLATTRSARQSWTGSALPFSSCSPASSYAIAASDARRVASPTSTVPGSAADWIAGGRVDEIAGDHPLAVGAEGDRGLAGEHTGASSERRVEVGHGGDEVEGGANGALGVVLLGDRRAPDRHHGVADELLDGAAVALDDRPRGLEVAGQELARVLGVARL